MTHKHTPGPWDHFFDCRGHGHLVVFQGCVEIGKYAECIPPDSVMIADCYALPDTDEADSNARLIAAAPAMLEELESGYLGSTLAETLRSIGCVLRIGGDITVADWLRAKADSIEAVVRKATGGEK